MALVSLFCADGPRCGSALVGDSKAQRATEALVTMIVGLALSEQPIFVSLFLIGADYPQYQIAVLMASVVSLIQFAPSYATPGYKLDSDGSES